MKIVTTALLIFLATQQKLPAELHAAQLANSGIANRVSSVAVGQTPLITNPQLPATQLEEREQTQLGDATFDMEFVGADLRLVLTGLARARGLNLVMPPDITGTVSIDLRSITVMQALEAILPHRGLEYAVRDSMLRVNKAQLETRTFTFDYITTQRSLSGSPGANSVAGGGGLGALGAAVGTGTLGATIFSGSGGDSSVSPSGPKTTDLLAELEAALNDLKSPEGKVIFQRMAGLVFATDYPRYLDTIGLFLETVQSSVHRQVVIEAKVIEVGLNSDSQAGVDWTALIGNAVNTGETLSVAPGFQIGVSQDDFNLVLTALKSQGAVNVLSSPTIATLNNQPAIMRVGRRDIFFTTTTQVDPRTGNIVQTAAVPTAINEGIALDVTPQISDDGIIIMSIHPTITERTGKATSPQGGTVPIVDVRETDTVVRVRQGQTVFIGGLISERQLDQITKVPLLGDVPFVGGLFRRTSKENRKTDLAILLRPRVLDIQTAVDYTRERIGEQKKLQTERLP